MSLIVCLVRSYEFGRVNGTDTQASKCCTSEDVDLFLAARGKKSSYASRHTPSLVHVRRTPTLMSYNSCAAGMAR